MAKNILTVELLREMLSYSPETGLFTRVLPTNNGKGMGRAGYLNPIGYIQIGCIGKRFLAHRLAWLYVHGVMPSGDIDHINGIRDDNRIENLRDVPHSVNIENQRKARPDNKSGYMGVRAIGKSFQASIRTDGRYTHIGTYATAEGAHQAYLMVKRQIHQGCTI